MKKMFVYIVIATICLASLTACQKKMPETDSDLLQRVDNLERQKDIIEKQLAFTLEQIEEKYKLKSSEIDFVLSTSKDQFDHDFIHLVYISLGSLLGIAGLVFSFYRRAVRIFNKIVDERVENLFEMSFDEHFNQKKDSIIQILRKHDEETELRENKRIIVLSPEESDEYFERMGFEKVQYHKMGSDQKPGDVDLIFFNGGNFEIKKDDIFKYIDKLGDQTSYFYYGKAIPLSDELLEKISFANLKSQIYGNLINALRYQSMMF